MRACQERKAHRAVYCSVNVSKQQHIQTKSLSICHHLKACRRGKPTQTGPGREHSAHVCCHVLYAVMWSVREGTSPMPERRAHVCTVQNAPSVSPPVDARKRVAPPAMARRRPHMLAASTERADATVCCMWCSSARMWAPLQHSPARRRTRLCMSYTCNWHRYSRTFVATALLSSRDMAPCPL